MNLGDTFMSNMTAPAHTTESKPVANSQPAVRDDLKTNESSQKKTENSGSSQTSHTMEGL